MDSRQEAGVRGFLDRQIKAFAKRDLTGLMTMLSPDATVVMLGNGPNERWVGPEAIKKAYQTQLAQYQSEKITLHQTSVGAKDSVAWFTTQARIL